MTLPHVLYRKFDSKRRFGVELEVTQKLPIKEIAKLVAAGDPDHEIVQTTGYAHTSNNSYWHVKFDRSCGDLPKQGGWEVASYVAKGYKDIDVISDVAKSLREGGAVVNDNCAFHIHAQISDMDINRASVLVANWMRIEPLLMNIVPKRRRDSKYCRLLTRKHAIEPDTAYDPTIFFMAVRPKGTSDAYRRMTLNMCNYCHVPDRMTAELRLPEGTLDSKDIKNWIRLFIHFIDTSMENPFPNRITPVGLKEALCILGLHGENPFLILSKALRETKMWFMKRLIKYAAKKSLVQEAEDFLYMMEIPPKPQKESTHERLLTPTAMEQLWWKSPDAFQVED